MLVVTPTIVGNEIEFPKEDGPYTVFLSGYWMLGSFMGPVSWRPGIGFNIGPFCYIIYPNGVFYNIENHTNPKLIVNGELRNDVFTKCPEVIHLNGFRGFVPTLSMYIAKTGYFSRIRVIGFHVEEIDLTALP